MRFGVEMAEQIGVNIDVECNSQLFPLSVINRDGVKNHKGGGMSDSTRDDEQELPGCSVCGGTGLIMGVVEGVAVSVPCVCTREGKRGILWPPGGQDRSNGRE